MHLLKSVAVLIAISSKLLPNNSDYCYATNKPSLFHPANTGTGAQLMEVCHTQLGSPRNSSEALSIRCFQPTTLNGQLFSCSVW